MKLKLSKPDAGNPGALPSSASVPTTPQVSTPGGGGGFKIKLKTSQPPTPVGEHSPAHITVALAPPPVPPPKVKRQYNKKPKDGSQKKRAADDDISPAPKRPYATKPNRRVSLKINPDYIGDDELAQAGPASATPSAKLKLSARKQSIGPKSISIVSRKAPPKRPVGVGYDSEASDAEQDPVVQQQFILRMQPGPDCDYLRDAINNRTIGLRPEEGGASVAMKFLDRELRRNMITIRGNSYAAVLVDLPCIIEGMKSWDKRGWWKVADICQMLLVLGPTENEASAKIQPLPKEVDKATYAFAHGLTPPMHWVRKRRFRKRASYKSMEHIDDEVERLIKADQEAEKTGGGSRFDIKDTDAPPEDNQEDYYEDDEPPSGFIDTTEDGYGQAYPAGPDDEGEEEEDEEDLEAMLAAEFAAADDDADADAEIDDVQSSIGMATATVAAAAAAAAAAPADPAAVLSVETPSSATAAPDTSGAATPAADASSDEDEEDDYDEDASSDAVDEDLVTKQAELAEQRSQVEDLEREVETARVDYERQKNALLKQRALNKLRSLRDELAMKKRSYGMDDGEEDDDE
ncbi:hypothetical protein MBLNU459_g3113t1 [Dothideomycetes sp. NU459]